MPLVCCSFLNTKVPWAGGGIEGSLICFQSNLRDFSNLCCLSILMKILLRLYRMDEIQSVFPPPFFVSNTT